jgi:site-specific DNA-methyltransferase (adenine-specific)
MSAVASASANEILGQVVWQGDCRELLRDLADESVACMVFSPPYNVGRPYAGYNDKLPEAEFFAVQDEAAAEMARLLRSNGHLFLVVGSNANFPWRGIEIALIYGRHFDLQQPPIAWVKSIAIDAKTLKNEEHRKALHEHTFGQFSISHSRRVCSSTHEYIFHFSPTGSSPIKPARIGVRYGYPGQILRFNKGRAPVDREVRDRGSSWHVPYPTIQGRSDRDDHPAVFPVALAEMCLKLADLKPDDLVLDPFCGIGSSLLAAKRLGLPAIGIELSGKYCQAARGTTRAARVISVGRLFSAPWEQVACDNYRDDADLYSGRAQQCHDHLTSDDAVSGCD